MFDATTKGEFANSYCDIEFADNYFEHHLDSERWYPIDLFKKQTFLVAATKRLNSIFFSGTPTDENQALQFPKTNLINKIKGDFYDPDEIPFPIKAATCELAVHYIKLGDEEWDLKEFQLEQYNNIKLGDLQIDIRDGYVSDTLPNSVQIVLRPITGRLNRFKTMVRA